MKKLNYDQISKIYDQVREKEASIVKSFFTEVTILESTKILDIGCGTGNYTDLIQKLTIAQVYGLDSSVGMLEKARSKNQEVMFKVGEATNLPFEKNFFDFIYMTDVIHHITDIFTMFQEVQRILQKNGQVCIVTQSHLQISNRYMTEFFPETEIVDQKRYPMIKQIVTEAENAGLKFDKKIILGQGEELLLGSRYLELLEKKGYSMLHLISESAYLAGLNKVRNLLKKGSFKRQSAGSTLVWFKSS